MTVEYTCSWCGEHHVTEASLCAGAKADERLVLAATLGPEGWDVDVEDDPPPIPRALPPESVRQQRAHTGRQTLRDRAGRPPKR